MFRSKAARTVKGLVHVTGIETISAILQQIPEDLRTDITANAVDAGARPVVIAAKRFAKRSERTGALREAIGHLVRKYRERGTAVAIIGVRKGYYRNRKQLGRLDDFRGSESPSHYAHLVEFGHNIVTGGSSRGKYEKVLVATGRYSTKGRELKRWKRGAMIEAPKGKVSGWVAPKPFMRPAIHTTKQQVIRAMGQALNRSILSTRRKLMKSGSHAA